MLISMKKALGTIGLVILASLAGVATYYFITISQAGKNSAAVDFSVASGDGLAQVADTLASQQIIRDKLVFQIYMITTGRRLKIQPGKYSAPAQAKLTAVAELITPNPNVRIEKKIKIIEGWQAQEIADYLSQEGVVASSEFLELSKSTDSRKILPEKKYPFLKDKPLTQGLEGYLFPDTYNIYSDSSGAEIIEKMLDNFDQKLSLELRAEIAAQGSTLFKTLVLASIVEKEGKTTQDRKVIAGIFLNRLREDIPLQSDATVNYITGKNKAQPSLEDLQASSEYNTYLYRGLPPGPICNPGLESIKAVIYPTPSDYYYFLTKPDGGAVFSKTYDEHLKYKEQYYGAE